MKSILHKTILIFIGLQLAFHENSNASIAPESVDAISSAQNVSVISFSTEVKPAFIRELVRDTNKIKGFDFGVFPKKPLDNLERFSVSGYYRFITNYRILQDATAMIQRGGYVEQAQTPTHIFVGDDSQIPQLSMNLSGSLASNTRFSTDLYIWSPMTGAGQAENVKGLNLGVSLTGTHDFKNGSLNIIAGGINWYALSPFTFHTNPGFHRYSVFERNPWDPQTKHALDRYNTFYSQGALNQDTRWGRQAFQGFIVEANDLPHGFQVVGMFGKTQLNGGMAPLPNQSYGGKIKKSWNKNFISLNSFNNQTYTDSLLSRGMGYNIHTAEYNLNWKGFLFSGEVGAGRYFSPSYTRGWGEALDLKMNLPKKWLKSDLMVRYYRISPKVFNNSSVFWNSSIREGNNTSVGSSDQLVLAPFASAMVPVGQTTNNRTGLEFNWEFTLGKLKTSIGYTRSQELERISSQITYSHPVNNLALSRFWRWGFPAGVGPYANLTKVYRGVFETVNQVDVDSKGIPQYIKHFNTLELHSKYKTAVLGHTLYLYYLGTYASVQSRPSWVTVFTEDAYLRTYYHQLEGYLSLTKSVVWANYIGWERIIANYETQVDALSRRPKNQEGWGIATGLDIEMSKNAGLYLRQRWMNYRDRSFVKDQYRGWESTLEIKIFF